MPDLAPTRLPLLGSRLFLRVQVRVGVEICSHVRYAGKDLSKAFRYGELSDICGIASKRCLRGEAISGHPYERGEILESYEGEDGDALRSVMQAASMLDIECSAEQDAKRPRRNVESRIDNA